MDQRNPPDRLERYLDQVCRSIAGPRDLRQHVRQELREHLLDALARHRAAGLSDEEALAKALQEFGKPEDVRSELEAAHGQRMMAVVIDKAMHWKEMTMKAKWLWTSWAYVGLAVVIALEVLFLTCTVIFIVPKFQQLLREGLIDPAVIEDTGAAWMPKFVDGLSQFGESYATWLVLLAIAAWALFEWLVRSENKPMMRLSALSTLSVGLMAVVWVTGASLLVAFCLGAPATSHLARLFAVDQIESAHEAAGGLDQALANKDWSAMQKHADRAARSLGDLVKPSAAIPALARRNKPPATDELRAHARTANERLSEVRQAIEEEDAARMDAALRRFRSAFGPLHEATKPAAP